MNRVLRTAMGVVAVNSYNFHHSLDRPVIRIDADAVDLQRNTVTNTAAAIQLGYGHLVKIPTAFGNYSGELELPDTMASRVAHINSITRYLLKKTLGPHDERSYHEESGSGAQLKDWLLLLNAWEQHDPNYLSNDGENRIFLELGKQVLDPDIPMFYYLPVENGLHVTSHRRIRKLAQHLKPWQIPLSDDGEDYQLFTDLAQQKERSVRPSVNDVKAMVGIMVLRHEALTKKPAALTSTDLAMLRSEVARANFFYRGKTDPHRRIASYWDINGGAEWLRDIKKLAEQRAFDHNKLR